MNSLEIGKIETLTVLRKIDTGYVLTNGKEEVLLHISESDEGIEEEQDINVFLYQDKKGQLVATMSLPNVRLDTYDWAEVVEVVKDLGVFVTIGINKEILVSKDDLPLLESVWPQAGDLLFVILDRDKKGRLLAKPATESVVENDWELAPLTIKNAPTSGRVYRTNKEGTVIITEEGYRGFIHHSERKQEPRLGEWVKGRVIDVKEDGTINVSLRPLKREGMIEDAGTILEYIESNGGIMLYSDKSDPEEIRNTFNLSKAAFKREIGRAHV